MKSIFYKPRIEGEEHLTPYLFSHNLNHNLLYVNTDRLADHCLPHDDFYQISYNSKTGRNFAIDD